MAHWKAVLFNKWLSQVPANPPGVPPARALEPAAPIKGELSGLIPTLVGGNPSTEVQKYRELHKLAENLPSMVRDPNANWADLAEAEMAVDEVDQQKAKSYAQALGAQPPTLQVQEPAVPDLITLNEKYNQLSQDLKQITNAVNKLLISDKYTKRRNARANASDSGRESTTTATTSSKSGGGQWKRKKGAQEPQNAKRRSGGVKKNLDGGNQVQIDGSGSGQRQAVSHTGRVKVRGPKTGHTAAHNTSADAQAGPSGVSLSKN